MHRQYGDNLTSDILAPFIQSDSDPSTYSQSELAKEARRIREQAAKGYGVKHAGWCDWSIRVGAFTQLVVVWKDSDGNRYENTETI